MLKQNQLKVHRLIFTILTIFKIGVGGLSLKEEILEYGSEKPLNSQDRLSITLLKSRPRVRDLHYTLVSSGEECVLKRYDVQVPVHRCEDLTQTICHPELVLLYKPVKEDCSKQAEFCQTFHRAEMVESETFVCQTSGQVICPGSGIQTRSIRSPVNVSLESDQQTEEDSSEYVADNYVIEYQSSNSTSEDDTISTSEDDDDTICHPNVVAICQTKPEIVTVTEQRQLCNKNKEMTTTKICITYKDGSWFCKNLTSDSIECDELHVEKVINSELTGSRLDCVEKHLDPICHSTSCHLSEGHSNKTYCVTDKLPKQVELKETVCEKCVEGRTKTRPVVEEKSICRNKTQTFCVDTTETETTWRKWCRHLIPGFRSTTPPTAIPADWTSPLYTDSSTSSPLETENFKPPFFAGLTDRSVIQLTTIKPSSSFSPRARILRTTRLPNNNEQGTLGRNVLLNLLTTMRPTFIPKNRVRSTVAPLNEKTDVDNILPTKIDNVSGSSLDLDSLSMLPAKVDNLSVLSPVVDNPGVDNPAVDSGLTSQSKNPVPANELVRIEVSPGHWILTKDPDTIDHFLNVQKENSQGTKVPESDVNETFDQSIRVQAISNESQQSSDETQSAVTTTIMPNIPFPTNQAISFFEPRDPKEISFESSNNHIASNSRFQTTLGLHKASTYKSSDVGLNETDQIFNDDVTTKSDATTILMQTRLVKSTESPNQINVETNSIGPLRVLRNPQLDSTKKQSKESTTANPSFNQSNKSTTTSIPDRRVQKQTSVQSSTTERDRYLERIIKCTKDPRNCNFTFL